MCQDCVISALYNQREIGTFRCILPSVIQKIVCDYVCASDVCKLIHCGVFNVLTKVQYEQILKQNYSKTFDLDDSIPYKETKNSKFYYTDCFITTTLNETFPKNFNLDHWHPQEHKEIKQVCHVINKLRSCYEIRLLCNGQQDHKDSPKTDWFIHFRLNDKEHFEIEPEVYDRFCDWLSEHVYLLTEVTRILVHVRPVTGKSLFWTDIRGRQCYNKTEYYIKQPKELFNFYLSTDFPNKGKRLGQKWLSQGQRDFRSMYPYEAPKTSVYQTVVERIPYDKFLLN